MTRSTIRALLSMAFLLCLCFTARAQQVTVTINGDSTVCTGSNESYYDFTYIPSTVTDTITTTWWVQRGSIALFTSPNTYEILWGAPGIGYIMAAAINQDGDTLAIDTMKVTILSLPKPRIRSLVRVACEPLDQPDEFNPPGSFDDSLIKVCAYNRIIYHSGGSSSSTYQWTVSGGAIDGPDFLDSCAVIWGGPGPGKIKVVETTSQGCIGEASILVDIIESPIAHFVALPDTSLRVLDVCKGTEVIFINRSYANPAAPIISWRWDFGDGSFSNQKGSRTTPITHKYDVAGSYTVSLTVTNECGCSTTETMEIHVAPQAGVEIICPGVVCADAIYDYRVDRNCLGSWTVYGGTVLTSNDTSIRIQWDDVDPNEGYGFIVFTPGDCPGYCSHPVATKIPVVNATAIIEGPNYLCTNQQYLYNMPQWPTTKYSWSLSNSNAVLQATDQPNEIVLTPTATSGTVTLTCTYKNTLLGCSGTASMVIQIPGKANYTDTVFDYCEPHEHNFMVTGPNASSAQWTLIKPDNTPETGSGSVFAINLNQIGSYLLSVSGNFCAPDPVEVRILGKPETPESIEGRNAICKGIPEEYLAGKISSKYNFEWSIVDGTLNTNAGAATEVTLNTSGTYPFTLKAYRVLKEKPYCKSDPKEFQINEPQISFSITGIDTVCPSSFTNYLISTFDVPESYEWSIIPQEMGSVDAGQGTDKVKIL